MVMLFEQSFSHFNPHAVIQVTEQFLLVQDQVWKAGANMNTPTDSPWTQRGQHQVGWGVKGTE